VGREGPWEIEAKRETSPMIPKAWEVGRKESFCQEKQGETGKKGKIL